MRLRMSFRLIHSSAFGSMCTTLGLLPLVQPFTLDSRTVSSSHRMSSGVSASRSISAVLIPHQ